jgi:hypothetical protein
LVLAALISACHVDLTSDGLGGAHTVADPRHFIVEFFHFLEVAEFVEVSLVLKVLALFFIHILPSFTDMLHDDESAHIWIFLHDFWPGLEQ